MRPSMRSGLRTINRVRWWHKYRASGTGRVPFPGRMKYVLWDPEVDTFSYELANPTALIKAIAPVVGGPASELSRYVHELRQDAELHDRIRRATRFHPEHKRDPSLGRHLMGYVCLRARRPSVAVEAGVRHGLGTLVMLRALERNAADGDEGTLVSVDIDPSAGVLVDRRNTRWEFAVGPAAALLPRLLADRDVGYLQSDTVTDPQQTRAEITAVCAHADWPLLVQQNAWNDVSRDICAREGFPFVEVLERSVGHWYPGRHVHLSSFQHMPSELS